jgi:hypothetical protein
LRAQVAGLAGEPREFRFSAIVTTCQQILNALSERAAVAADRSRFATLPARYLDDIGMTQSERAAILHYQEPLVDGWRVIASHL